jgi:hypothetical protein
MSKIKQISDSDFQAFKIGGLASFKEKIYPQPPAHDAVSWVNKYREVWFHYTSGGINGYKEAWCHNIPYPKGSVIRFLNDVSGECLEKTVADVRLFYFQQNDKRMVGLEYVLDNSSTQEGQFLEQVADLCHEQWVGWMEYLFSKTSKNPDGTRTIPAWAVSRWQRQMSTLYADLSEPEKDSDRAEADRFIKLFRNQQLNKADF